MTGVATTDAATMPAKINAPRSAGQVDPPIHMTGSTVTAPIAHTARRITTADFARVTWSDRLANIPLDRQWVEH